MNPELMKMAQDLREYGLKILGGAACDATFGAMIRPNAFTMSVSQAAHGTELMLKAKIIEAHARRGSLESDIRKEQHKVRYADLPDWLRSVTGYEMRQRDAFLAFGVLAWETILLDTDDPAHGDVTLRFVLELAEPMVNELWGESIALYADGYAQEHASRGASVGFLPAQLQRLGIPPTKLMREYFAKHASGRG